MGRPKKLDEEKQKMRVTVRLTEREHDQVAASAAACRLPLASFFRIALLEKTPPAPVHRATEKEIEMLKIVGGLLSNLSQVRDHCLKIGGPFEALAGEHGPIQKMIGQAKKIGLACKLGRLDDEQLKINIELLLVPAGQFNDDLARPLNAGQAVVNSTWHTCITAVQRTLDEASA